MLGPFKAKQIFDKNLLIPEKARNFICIVFRWFDTDYLVEVKIELTEGVVVFSILVRAEAETLTEANVAIVLLIGLK